MPKAYLDPITAWYPSAMDTTSELLDDKQRFTLLFMGTVPDIMVSAMNEAFGEDVNRAKVVPRFKGPTDYVLLGTTPDLEFTAAPTHSVARAAKERDFRRQLAFFVGVWAMYV